MTLSSPVPAGGIQEERDFADPDTKTAKYQETRGHDTLHDWITRTTQSSVLERIQRTQNASLSATKTKSQNTQGFGRYPGRKRMGLPVFMVK